MSETQEPDAPSPEPTPAPEEPPDPSWVHFDHVSRSLDPDDLRIERRDERSGD